MSRCNGFRACNFLLSSKYHIIKQGSGGVLNFKADSSYEDGIMVWCPIYLSVNNIEFHSMSLIQFELEMLMLQV